MSASPGALERLRRWLDAPPEVRLVCEVAADYVAAARYRQGSVEAWAVRPLPAGVVRPAALTENVANPEALRESLEHVVGAVTDGQRRCVLVIPDLAARVTLLEFDRVPDRPDEAEALIRWRLGRDLPFDPQQAVLSFAVQPGRDSAQEVLVAACLRGLVGQYESALERLGLQPGFVTLSTLAALGCLGARNGPRLLVKRDLGSLGLALQEGDAVRLFRSLPLPHADSARGEEELLEKVYPAVVYYQDQWGKAVDELVLVGSGRTSSALVSRLQQEAGCPVRELKPESFDLPPSPVSGDTADGRLLPCLGWIRGEVE